MNMTEKKTRLPLASIVRERKHKETPRTAGLPYNFLIPSLVRIVHMGKIPELSWLIGLVRQAHVGQFLVFPVRVTGFDLAFLKCILDYFILL